MKRKVLFVLIFTLTIGLTAAVAQQVNYKLSGYVYEGECNTEPPTASPLYGVLLRLYGSYKPGDLGIPLVATTTSSDGSYSLPVPSQYTGQQYEYYTIVCEGKSGYDFVCARSIGGSAMYEQIRYASPLEGKTLTDNNFWYISEAPENNPPVANDDVASTNQDTPVTIDVLANDSDPDGDPLTVDSVTDPPNGSAVNNGDSVTYTPDPGWTGTDTFDYTVSDGKGGTDTATVYVRVLPVEGGECTINVYKWEDKNGNCVWDEDEQGLGKWKICLDYNQNCQCDTNEPFTYTDATGHGWFDNLACQATYYLAEELKPGWERTCPNTPPCQVEIHTAPPTVTHQVVSVVWFGNRRVGRYDFGDAPDSYSTLHASGGPYHDVNPLLCLGGTVDVDSDGQPDPHALGDDNDGSDDEGGVTFLTNLVAGDLAKVSLTVRNDSASVANVTVVGWVNFNGNGTFEPLDELIGHQNLLVSPMTVTPVEFSFTVPPGAMPGQTFARFRLYHVDGATNANISMDIVPGIAYIITPTGYGYEGEVEDHEVEITSEDGGCIIKVYKWHDKDGDCVLDIGEPGLGNWKICLDYNHNCQCDPNEPFKITDGGGWAFFDNLACRTTYYLAEELKPGWQRTCPATPPCQVTIHTTSPEDVQRIWFGNRRLTGNFDFGDAPEPYPTKLVSGGAFHFLSVGPFGPIFPWLGPTVDPDPDGQPDPLAQGDDSDIDGDDEDGVIGGPFVQGIPVALSVTVSTMPGVLEAWIDWNGNKIWEHPAEQVYAGLLSIGTHDIYVTAPFGCVERPFGRFRISSQGGLPPTGYARDGEVEDRQFDVLAVDWGDAPISYPTLGIHGGASHTFMPSSPEAFMGIAIDGEINGQPHPHAFGDDVDPDGDDEDGVTFLTMPLVAGQQGKVRVVLNGSGFFTIDLSAWIDFNQDNDWDEPDDMILFQSLPVGTHDLTFNVPPGAKPGVTYARFRSRVAVWPTPPAKPTGHEFFTGEVEDYKVRVVEEGEPNGPPEEQPYVKWSQPPIEINPVLSAGTRTATSFCGWDESAVSTAIQEPRGWVMVADDFRCLGPIPITRIRWWGSYENWRSSQQPDILPISWQINFWSNMPKHVVTNFSFPEKLLWQIEVPSARVTSWAVGFDNCPNKPTDLCFEYNLELKTEQWFWQNNFETQDNVFWISITAIYSDGVRVPNLWGWKSRPEAWMDLAVRFALQGDGPDLGMVLDPGQIVPVERQVICNEVQDFDMSFELLTEEPWIKWDQSYTGIRDWPHYEDEVSMGTEDQTGQINISRQVADDWLCDQLNPVIAVAWQGSYIGYGYEACQCHESSEPYRPDYFLLSIWTDAPADSEVPFNHPGNKVWEYKALEYNEVQVGFDKHPEGEPNEAVFRYSVRLPEDDWFQQDTLNQIYWFSVVAIYEEPADNVPYRWGWTNHDHMYKSNATAKSNNTMSATWEQLYDQVEEPADMSFMLFTSEPVEF